MKLFQSLLIVTLIAFSALIIALMGRNQLQTDEQAGQPEELVKRYLLCEDLDCVDALQVLKTCAGRCVPALLQTLKTGLPLEIDPRSTEFARARSAQALGELADRSALGPLIQTLTDPSPQLRAASAQALGRLKIPEALNSLKPALRAETDAHARTMMETAIRAIEKR